MSIFPFEINSGSGISGTFDLSPTANKDMNAENLKENREIETKSI